MNLIELRNQDSPIKKNQAELFFEDEDKNNKILKSHKKKKRS